MHEIKDWKGPYSLKLEIGKLSDREPFSREINETYGEGGGLNANYTTVEAVAVAANVFGKAGLVYGKDFIFKTTDFVFDAAGRLVSIIIFDFSAAKTKVAAEQILRGKGLVD